MSIKSKPWLSSNISRQALRSDVRASAPKYRNKQIALELLKSRLQQQTESAFSSSRAADRKRQIGLGERSEKRRTIRIQDGTVKDPVTGKVWRYEDYAAGMI